MAKLPTFNREVSKVSEFLMACRLRIRDISVEEQILCVIEQKCGQTLARVRVSQT